MRTITISNLFMILLVGMPWLASGQDKAAIETKLTAQYALTQPTADDTDIVTAGSILVLKKSNLMMAPVSSTNFYQNSYKDGKITQNAAGKVTNVLKRINHIPGASAPEAPSTRTYVAGEKMWVTKIEAKEDGVVFSLFTDAVADVRYKAALKFQFPKGISLSTDQVEKLVAEVFKVQPAEDSNSSAQQPRQNAPSPSAAQQTVETPPSPVPPPPAPAESIPAPIPPPPPPVDEPQVPPKTISLGETKEKVLAEFGQPQKKGQAAGAKEIFFYKDMKVTFVGGKVTDVQ